VLVGKVPAELDIKAGGLGFRPVAVPPRMPSTLLERRPDIAAAERTMQQQNELIGVAAAAFYPDISLSGVIGAMGASALPLTAANEIWSLGGSATQILFDGGLRNADVAAATATYDQSVATYRQTVLTAFQQVEDDLAALRIEDQAIAAARQAVDITLNEYRAGTVAFTSVVTAQATLLGDQETALTIRQNRYLASVGLIQALGGGWTTGRLAAADELKAAPTPPAQSPDLSSALLTPKLHL
jgi:NodT family efflux transporter outer membrane factor (OMF) lipoprotein